MVWFNLKDYTPFSLISFGTGCLIWAVLYGFEIYSINKTKKIGIPIAAIMCNFAWEINWGLIYKTDMGFLFQIAYFIWFFLDCYIVYKAFQYGKHQMFTPSGKQYYVPTYIGVLAVWFGFYFLFIPEYDDKFGALTGWITNMFMSVLFVYQRLNQPDFGAYNIGSTKIINSKLIAVLKLLGTGSCTFVCFQRYPDHKTLLFLCIAFAVVDIVYIFMVYLNFPKRSIPDLDYEQIKSDS
ncbi:MAG: hypothetical protein SFY32_02225 [Bacteroidota bacterium]|nr:hypothetical protein [Bacteroidota bacterium]